MDYVGPYPGPEGADRGGDRGGHEDEHRRAARALAPVLEPREQHEEWRQHEASVDVRPDHREDGDEPDDPPVVLAHREHGQRGGEEKECQELGARREPVAGDEEAPQAEPRGGAGAGASGPAGEVDELYRHGGDRGVDEGDDRPPARPVEESEHHLRAPLLIEPGAPQHRERQGVGSKDVSGLEHELPRADLVGEVDGRHRGPERDECRREDDGGCQQLRERESAQAYRRERRRRSVSDSDLHHETIGPEAGRLSPRAGSSVDPWQSAGYPVSSLSQGVLTARARGGRGWRSSASSRWRTGSS